MITDKDTDTITPVPKIRGLRKLGINFKNKTISMPKQYHKFIESEAKRLGIKRCAVVRGLLNKYKDWFTMIDDYETSIMNVNLLPSSVEMGSNKFNNVSRLLQIILSLEIIPRNDRPIKPLPLDIPKEIIIQYFQTFFHKATGTNINSPISFECNGLKYVLRGNVFACVGGDQIDYIPKTKTKKK